MEPLFEIRYTRDREWAKNIYKYLFFRRPIFIVFHVIFLMYFILGILMSIVNHYVEYVLLAFPLFWCIYIIFTYCRNVNLSLKRDLELHGKPIEINVTVTDENIKYVQSTGAELYLNYADIKKVVRTGRYVFLRTKTNLYCAFKNDAFTIGNNPDFLAFLKSKGVKIK